MYSFHSPRTLGVERVNREDDGFHFGLFVGCEGFACGLKCATGSAPDFVRGVLASDAKFPVVNADARADFAARCAGVNAVFGADDVGDGYLELRCCGHGGTLAQQRTLVKYDEPWRT